MAAIDSGTMAAVVPIEVPAMSRVSGISATIRMMKGMERKALTTAPTPRLSARCSQSPPGAVLCSARPSGRPSRMLTAPEAAVMTSVSTSAWIRRS